MGAPSVLARFLAGLDTPRGGAPNARAAAQAQVQGFLTKARSGLPSVVVPESALLAYLSERVPTGEDPLQVLPTLHAEDLYIACASLHGHPEALRALDATLQRAVAPAVMRVRNNPTFVDEVQQLLRQKLLVGVPPSPPKLRDYRGRGSLAQWLRAAGLRVALNHLESLRPAELAGPSGFDRLAERAPDPELALVKSRYAPEFKAALETALAGLTAKERNYLRLYFVEGMTVEQIGKLEGSHKSTISRWMTKARAQLLARVRELLSERLDITDRELDSLFGALQSQLDMSLLRVLEG